MCFILLVSFSVQGFGRSLRIDKKKCTVSFLAQGRPSAIKIEGEGAHCEGEFFVDADQESLGRITIDLSDFTTGMGLRDRHMHEKYLETKKEAFKKATLTFSDIKKFRQEMEDGTFKGTLNAQLSLHGVTREVPVNLDFAAQESKSKGHFKFQLKISDYGIEIPSFMEITMADVVDVSGEVEAAIH